MNIIDILPVSRGEKPADLLIKNAKLVNVFSGEIENTNIAIFKKRIAGIGDYQEGKEILNLEGAYVVPGLIDAHLHIESAMVDPVEFSRAVLTRGTTTVIADPHEIANVAGLKGVEYMLHSTEGIPLNIYFMIPSCVPATDLSTSGAIVDVMDMIGFIEKHPRVLGLGEVMNFPGVINGDRDLLTKIELIRHKYKKIDGHSPGLRGKPLNAYISAFIRSDHESSFADEAKEKLARGMQVLIREGSSARNMEALLPIINEITYPHLSFCTDDKHPGDILTEGHIDYIVRKAIKKGINPIMAIKIATINTAIHYGLRSMGAISPGYKADMVITESLENFDPKMVIKDAKIVAVDKKLVTDVSGAPYRVDEVYNSFKCPFMKKEDIVVKKNGGRIRVIKVMNNDLLTEEIIFDVNDKGAYIESDIKEDILKTVVVNRYSKEKRFSIGFITGTGIKTGAIATSVGHDAHNLLGLGTNDDDIIVALNRVIELKGGLVAVDNKTILEELPLPIGGLMSDKKVEIVAGKIKDIKRTVKNMGATLSDTFMTLAFAQLEVIPDVRLTDQGIVNVKEHKVVSLFLK